MTAPKVTVLLNKQFTRGEVRKLEAFLFPSNKIRVPLNAILYSYVAKKITPNAGKVRLYIFTTYWWYSKAFQHFQIHGDMQ